LDANVLVNELLKRRGIRWISGGSVELSITDRVLEEVREHLPRRLGDMVKLGQIDQEQAATAGQRAFALMEKYIGVVPTGDVRRHREVAKRRIPGDEDDWPTAALALTTGLAIVTENRKHFWGCGIAIWSVERFLAELQALER
jgi:predicted nucleic acid-binding protein